MQPGLNENHELDFQQAALRRREDEVEPFAPPNIRQPKRGKWPTFDSQSRMLRAGAEDNPLKPRRLFRRRTAKWFDRRAWSDSWTGPVQPMASRTTPRPMSTGATPWSGEHGVAPVETADVLAAAIAGPGPVPRMVGLS
jgi:hypothetical protein